MGETITAAEANRQFSRILGEVRDGASYVVTSHGKPVARIVPISVGRDVDGPTPEQLEARRQLIERLRSQPIVDIGPWNREELYER
jgi:prevent-host-death family protein